MATAAPHCCCCSHMVLQAYSHEAVSDQSISLTVRAYHVGVSASTTAATKADGIARRVASKSCARDFNGALTVPCLLSREACTSGRSNKSWACSRITKLLESRARATLEKTGQISIALIYGGSVEIGSPGLVDGRSANLHSASRKSGAILQYLA